MNFETIKKYVRESWEAIPPLDWYVWVALAVMVIAIIAGVVWLFAGSAIVINNHHGTAPLGGPTSPLTGVVCDNATKRPVAVMVSSDAEARPLSGIGSADMVIEMPVTPNGVTRMMAIFQCNQPKEIGSIRSARGSFIPLVQGLHALYVHWGGEHDSETALQAHITDDVDCLIFDGTTCYRKSGIPRPHNGFSTLDLIYGQAAQLGYAASVSIPSFAHLPATGGPAAPTPAVAASAADISIPYPVVGMNVSFHYDPVSNTYLRSRGGTPERDAIDGKQVAARVVVVMHTEAKFLYDQYISVRMTGTGTADIYQNGQQITAHWSKSSDSAPLQFVDSHGDPVPLAVGTLWVEFLTTPLPIPTP